MDIHVWMPIGTQLLVSWTSLVIPWDRPTPPTTWNSLSCKCTSCRNTWINEKVKFFLQKWMFVPQTHVNVLLLLFLIFRDTNISCPLVVTTHSYSCVCKVTSYTFASFFEYHIRLCHESDCQTVTETFAPSENSKYELMCLSDLDVCWCLCLFTCMYSYVSA